MSSSSRTSTMLFHDFLGHFYSRRLLLHVSLYPSPDTAIPPVSRISYDSSEPYTGHNSFYGNLVVVLSVLSCAIVCLLGLHSIIRCALRCTCFVGSGTRNNPSAELASTGIKKKVLGTFPTLIYSDGLNLPGFDIECVICLSEFTNNEHVRVLPMCNHGFHVRCIDMWLNSHSSCPTCRHSLIETCEKVERCSRANTSEPPPPPQPETVVNIVPLQPEGLIPNYRNDQDVKIYVEKMKVPIVVS